MRLKDWLILTPEWYQNVFSTSRCYQLKLIVRWCSFFVPLYFNWFRNYVWTLSSVLLPQRYVSFWPTYFIHYVSTTILLITSPDTWQSMRSKMLKAICSASGHHPTPVLETVSDTTTVADQFLLQVLGYKYLELECEVRTFLLILDYSPSLLIEF